MHPHYTSNNCVLPFVKEEGKEEYNRFKIIDMAQTVQLHLTISLVIPQGRENIYFINLTVFPFFKVSWFPSSVFTVMNSISISL